MEWVTLHHLDLRHVGRDMKPSQPHAAAFHPNQALIAVATGNYVIEFDAFTGSKISTVDIGARVIRMSYSPTLTSVHTIIAILEDCTIRSCDFDSEQTCVLHSPEKKMEPVTSDTEVHLALTPIEPVVFFGFHRRMSVTVVGTIDGGKAPTKIKTDLKKPIVNISCHPRLPVLYVAYADGLIRAYNVQILAVLYTLQLDSTIKLIGASAFAFHPTLEWIFVGDRKGTLLAWDVSTERPNMIGITQVGSQPISSISWLPISRLLVTVSKDGTIQVWKTRVIISPNQPPTQATFFEDAAIEPIDLPRILSQQDGESLHPLPKIKALHVHPKLNLATLVLSSYSGGDNMRSKAAYTRDGRKQLFAILQGARGSSASVLKEKLTSLGSSGILADHQLQLQLQEHIRGQSQLTLSDIARKAFLYSHFMEGHSKMLPFSRLPVITIVDPKHYLRNFPVCQPFHLEINFFNKGTRVVHYPVRSFYIDGVNLMAYNLSSGEDGIYKKLYDSIPANVEYHPKSLIYSRKQHMFLVVYEFSGATNEVVLYWENTDFQLGNSKASTLKGMDAAFIGPNDNQFAVLDDDRMGVSLYIFPGSVIPEVQTDNGASDQGEYEDRNRQLKGPIQFMFETEVDRIFCTPIESTLMFASHGNQIGLAKLAHGYSISSTNGHYIPTESEGRKSIKLNINEAVLQVQWQETVRGYVAGVLTTKRVLIISADLVILAGSSMKYDKGIPSFRSILWVGPALLFSTSTAISMLGWDGVVRTILSISMPSTVLMGALNDRLLLANPADVNPKQKKGIQIKNCLVGLLEPLLIGFVTMRNKFEQNLVLSETLYQITSRFDSLRVTPRSLEILAGGPPVCGDLAVALSQSAPQFAPILRGIYAIKARRFLSALSVLKDEFLRSRDYPKCLPTSLLFHRFRQLGYACIKYGQFDSAKETFEVISDYESIMDMFVCHLNPSAMRHLAQKLEEEGSDPELRRYCERILRVRSTGWTQGIFANFSAESMVPKGAEWGGGNWEIKIPTNLKDIPRWELAAEVMPYMRTDDGAIPSIIPDHIGVYLGLVRGRGNVVQVREDSLVKAIASEIADSSEIRSARPVSAIEKGVPAGIIAGDSVIVGKHFPGSSAANEQTKAEEEFKKSLYGGSADASSSGEEDASKTKKLHIRIRDKPVTSAVVDVNKIKEATRQFKLGDGLGLPSRTRSLSGGSQDIGLVTQDSSTSVSASVSSSPVTLFGTDSMIKPPVSLNASGTAMDVGIGVAAGPIPEDFFQDTISSLHVAASLPPAGSYLSKLDQNDLGAKSDSLKLRENLSSGPDSVLPNDGIRVSEQSDVRIEDFGLPDGGVPPQSVDQPSVQGGRITVEQPFDLSILGAPGSSDSGRAAVRPASLSTSVRPGQVPRGYAAPVCFKTGVAHLEQNQLPDALSCFDEAFLALAKDLSRGTDIKAQVTICAQYKIAVTLLQEIARLQKVQGPSAVSAKDEMARLARHLASLPLLAKHRINCIRTAVKRNMEVQNYAYTKQMLELLLSKAPPNKQDELRSLIDMCIHRGLSNKSIDPLEDPSQFCAATLSRLSTIGYDVCDLCGAKFSALSAPGCIICGMGSIKRSDAIGGPVVTPFG